MKMKRLKRALSLAKSAPRIEESISEIDEYLKDVHIDSSPPQEESNSPYEHSQCLVNGNNNSHQGNLCLFLG